MKHLLLWLALCGLSACSTSDDPDAGNTGAFEDFEAGRDYFSEKVTVNHAKNFTVEYHDNYKVVTTKVGFGTAEQDADSLAWERAFSDVMVLVQRGTPPPALVNELANAVVIEIPAIKVAANSDDAPTRLMAITPTENIIGLGHKDICHPVLKEKVDAGEIAPIGASWHTGPDLEMLLSIRPDLTFLTAASLTQADGIKRTRDMGLQAAPDFSWSETSYLGQLEWIKYDALFLNAEAKANQFFNAVKSTCDSLKQLVERRNLEKPQVMWGMHGKSGLWRIRMNGSVAQLLVEAGGLNPFEDKRQAVSETLANGLSEGITISNEVVLEKASDIQYIISFQRSTEYWPTENYLNTIPAYRNRQLYHHFKRYQANGCSDWYQTASMRPDLLLKDLIKLFHPDLLPTHELFFLDKIQLK